jgi:hypothetical protein
VDLTISTLSTTEDLTKTEEVVAVNLVVVVVPSLEADKAVSSSLDRNLSPRIRMEMLTSLRM